MGNNKKRRAPEVDTRKFRKKTSILTYEGISYIDYKDVNLLRKFMSERAKIRQRNVTGNSQKQQREIAKAIRISREMALLPFNVRQVTSKSKKRRDEDEGTLDQVEREARGEKPERGYKGDKSSRPPRADKPEKSAEKSEKIEEVPTEDQTVEKEAQALIEAETVVASEEA
jgi:small subunit ribosomal protein S18